MIRSSTSLFSRASAAGNVVTARLAKFLTLSRAVVIALFVGGSTSLVGLGSQPLSWDEAVTASAASRPLPRLWGLLSHTDAPLGFYYAVMHGWIRVLEAVGITPTEFWWRLPSALAAIVAVVLIVILAARYVGAPIALAAGVLLAVHPLFVFYSHDARPYSLVTALVILATLLFIRALEKPSPLWLSSYALVAIAAVYMHLFGALALIAHAVVVLIRAHHKWRWFAVDVVILLASLPLLLLARAQVGEVSWVPPESTANVSGVLLRLAGGVGMLVPLLLAGLLAIRRFRLATLRRRSVWIPLLVGWAVAPVTSLILGGLVTPVFVARYALAAVPAFLLLTVAAVRGRSRLGVVFIVLALLGGVVTTVNQQSQPFKYEDYRAAADTVADHAHPGDGVVFLPASGRVGYDEYVASQRDDQDDWSPTDIVLRRGGAPAATDRIGGAEAQPRVESVRITSRHRVFLVGLSLPRALHSRHSASERAKELALAHYRIAWVRRFGGIRVTLFLKESTAGRAGQHSY